MKVENKKYETFTHSQRSYLIGNVLKRTSDILFIFLFFLVGIAIVSLFTEGATLAGIEIFFLTPFIFWLYYKLRSVNKELKIWTQEYMNNSYVIIFNTIIPKGNSTEEKIIDLAKQVFPELHEQYSKFYTIDKIGDIALRIFLKKLLGKKIVRIVTDNVNSKIGKEKYHVDLAIKTLEGYFIVKDFNEKILTENELKNFIKILDNKINTQKILQYLKLIDSKIFRLIFVAKHYDQQFLERESLEKIMIENLRVNFKVDLIIEEEDKVGYTVLWTG
jgi:hypothetical protein